ncbi:MAG: hypothetical protein E6J17_03195 [Chloroflexi bacterium]|nr:MAG: hypothetical protein E6J17_03195 [Chloroflexota bacterium]
MRTDHPTAGPWPPGLCGPCIHGRVVKTAKGSRFLLCELSRTDPRFPRYPTLPVLACEGFEGSDRTPETTANRP